MGEVQDVCDGTAISDTGHGNLANVTHIDSLHPGFALEALNVLFTYYDICLWALTLIQLSGNVTGHFWWYVDIGSNSALVWLPTSH